MGSVGIAGVAWRYCVGPLRLTEGSPASAVLSAATGHGRHRLGDSTSEDAANGSLTPSHPAGGIQGSPTKQRNPAVEHIPAAARPDPRSKLGEVAARRDRAEVTKRELQLAGLAVLMSLSTATMATGPLPALPGDSTLPIHLLRPPLKARPAPATDAGAVRRWRFAALAARLRADHMVRNSLYLILSSGIQAALGFTFWIITARLFSATQVGQASSLISATTLIAFFSLLGLNSTFVRYLPTVPDRDSLITAGLALVTICGAVIGLAYVLVTPRLAPRLAFVAHRPALAAGFVVLTAAGAINLLTDSIFIAARKAGYNGLVDGGIGGTTKVISGVALAGSGAYGLFCASASSFAAAALASILLMAKVLRWRPSLRAPVRALRPLLSFSGANYVGNVFNLLPTLVVPLIVLDRIGASAAAYYFVSFQVATLLYSAAYAVEQAFLAEGGHAGVVDRALLRRSFRVLVALCLPACLVLTLSAHWVLLAFGSKYSQHGASSLILFSLAALPIAAGNWLMTVLRLAERLSAIVVSNVINAAAICGLAWYLAPRGLTAVAAAWPIGALAGALVAGIAAAAFVPRATTPRHRRISHAGRAARGRRDSPGATPTRSAGSRTNRHPGTATTASRGIRHRN
jgi:O-antigen/teichoic acid export membrane protein